MSPEVDAALWLAYGCHAGQYRRFLPEPYIVHPVRVRAAAEAIGFGSDAQVAALLHDVLEDTTWSAAGLRDNGVSKRAVELVVLLTKPEGFLPERDKPAYYAAIQADPMAATLKALDRLDNLRDMGRILRAEPSAEAVRWARQYARKTEAEFEWVTRVGLGLAADLAAYTHYILTETQHLLPE